MIPLDKPSWRYGLFLVALALALVLFASPPSSLSTLALLALGAITALLYPPAIVAAVILSVPIQDAVVLPIAGNTFTITQITMLGLVAGWGVSVWRRNVWLDGVWWWFVAVLGALILSLAATDDLGLWAGEFYRWGVTAVFYLICRSVLRDWTSVRLALWAMVAAVCAASAYSFGQVIATNGPPDFMQGGVLRAYGAFGKPNPLAAYMEIVVPLLIALVLVGLRYSVRQQLGVSLWLATIVACAMGTATVALTQSRGGWIGFAAALLVLLLVVPMRLRMFVIGAGAVLILVMLLTPVGASQRSRFSESIDSSEALPKALLDSAQTGREWIWGAAIGMFNDSPLTGVGAGEFDYHFRQYTTDWNNRFPLGQAHNGYLQMAAQSGIPGVIAFVGWLSAMLVSLASAAGRDQQPVSRALALGGLAIVVAFAVHSVVDYLNVLSLGLQLAAAVAIGLNLAPQRLPIPAPQAADPSLTPNRLDMHDD